MRKTLQNYWILSNVEQPWKFLPSEIVQNEVPVTAIDEAIIHSVSELARRVQMFQ